MAEYAKATALKSQAINETIFAFYSIKSRRNPRHRSPTAANLERQRDMLRRISPWLPHRLRPWMRSVAALEEPKP